MTDMDDWADDQAAGARAEWLMSKEMRREIEADLLGDKAVKRAVEAYCWLGFAGPETRMRMALKAALEASSDA